MGFRFSYVCDLLSTLEDNRHLKATSAARTQNQDLRIISSWCSNHSKRIYDEDTNLLALLSCLFLEKRPDRVYWLQHASLARIIGRCLYLGSSRLNELTQWKTSGGKDLGECVQNVMSQAENQIPSDQFVTVEEIDDALQEIASRCRFSSSGVRKKHAAVDVNEALGSLYRRLSSRDGKWLTRMILKSYHPVQLPTSYFLENIHFLLPCLLLFQDSLEAAVNLLKSPSLKLFPSRPQPDFAGLLSNKALQHLIPQLGVKIGRPEYCKARSIKHCCNMICQRRMSLERKYDGEYCQIHIDLTKGQDCIQIFSKSGKDSTFDRVGIHDIIKRSLAIGETHCKVSRHCILEGELLVWDDRKGQVLEFHKLRKFISRSGVFIGADLDSQPKPYEHLMIIFFDILLLDDDICLSKPHRLRRLLLKETVNVLPGRADISEQEIIDFSRQDGVHRLQATFAKSIAERWEGLVIKACDEPYFSGLLSDNRCRWIKLKKDYIPGLGDTADFALIGARYDPKDAATLSNIQHLSWTHFFIGCLDNKEDVIRLSATPRFRIVDMIGTHSLSVDDMQVLNQWGQFVACDVDSNTTFESYNVHNSLPSMDIAFKIPFVVELLGSGFDKLQNAQYYTLRFPRVLKIYWDRTYEDAISFIELQELAEKARSSPADENDIWCQKIDATNRKTEYIVDKSQSTSSGSLFSSPDLIPPSKEAGAPLSDKTCSYKLSPSCNNVHATTTTPVLPLTMEYSELSNESPSQQLRARGSPVPRVWTTSIGSSLSNPPSRVGSSITTPLRENPNLSSAMPNLSQITSNNLTKSLSSVLDRNYSQGLPKTEIPVMDASINRSNRAPTDQRFPSGVPTSTGDIFHSHPLPAHLVSPLSTLPMYCAEFGFVENIFRLISRDFTFSTTHFVESLAFPYNRERLRTSNPAAADSDIALGVVLVNTSGPANTLATQLYNVGNQVAAQLSGSHTNLPHSGKIFFLDRCILNAGGPDGIHNKCFLLNDWWSEYGTRYYYATISWGYGKDVNQLHQHRRGAEPNWYNYHNVPNVVNLYDPSDVEVLGEFVSIEPTIHLQGDHYYVPGAPKSTGYVRLGANPVLSKNSRSWNGSSSAFI